MSLTYSGPLAIYFNRHATDGRVWCIAGLVYAEDGGVPGGWEVCVIAIDVTVPIISVYTGPPPKRENPHTHDGPPTAWFRCTGALEITTLGFAFVRPIKVDSGHG